MNSRRQMHGRNQPGGPIGKIFQGLATGVGLASESIHHHKEKKNAQKQQEEKHQQGMNERAVFPEDRAQGETISGEDNEEAWKLDEAQQELSRETNPNPSTPGSPQQLPELADNFIHDHPLPEHSESPPARIQLPVVLTQRRPRARDRGFIKAYAPVLEDVGIDQATFLEFIDKLNKAVEPSPWIQAINLAGFAAQHVPLAVSIAVSAALKIIANSASEVQSRTKTNSFLDKINEEYFMPRGLIAVLVAWKPEDPSAVTTVNFDLESTVAKSSPGSNQGTFAKIQGRMKSSSAATSYEFPETAPLIFPDLDKLASTVSDDPNNEAKKQNIIKRGGGFVGHYLDRRAVAQWAGENPDSRLANAVPKPEFHSRYADPNHPASSGDPLAFVTGGKLSTSMLTQNALGGARRGGFDRVSIMDGRNAGMSGRGFDRGPQARVAILESRRPGHSHPPSVYEGQDRGAGRFHDQPASLSRGGLGGSGIGPLSLIGGVKKLLQKDVLYLMIVNLPTEEETAQATAGLE
ncbi:hypothetical protein VP1G_02571 [Cytospora mali]|uniref:Uncharacterized protein n=1 Tax=Cytospora mali TaxID=578113 RepID=A0A194UU02_CYTMA|nr:hypothetical protein VP1G_02571 [Valsa mali var. pyri (nom. inval.)]